MTVTVAVPGTLYAALAVCHPNTLPTWLTATTPRCATGHHALLQLDGDRASQLADLIAAALWECEQAGDDGEPFTSLFAQACRDGLDSLADNGHTRSQTPEGTT
ncbi:hypothetical protein ACFYWP_37140 [Actinacidiphila glaucinigra]|uniref:hypothetical protein n=1 Tax=Actinacidiphila glaucinigra TaxID=235986 RepID=UPI0036CD135B